MQREILPERAAVRPRVLPTCGTGGEPVLLEELVADKLARGARGHLHLIGPPGSGRTTALRHLAQCLGPRDELVLSDHTSAVEEVDLARGALLVSTTRANLAVGESWCMAPWSDDDRIEYLLARHPAACGSVLARCQRTPAWLDLQGLAALWAACLDELARDSTVIDVTSALARTLERALDAAEGDATLRAAVLNGLLCSRESEDRNTAPAPLHPIPALLRAALDIPSAALCLGAIVARRDLMLRVPNLKAWHRGWRVQGVQAVAAVFPASEEALAEIERATHHDDSGVRCKAMGVLHLLDPVRSARALLSPDRSPDHTVWSGVDLQDIALPGAAILGSELLGCSLRGADLERANLDVVDATETNFSQVRMQDSGWWTVSATGASFMRSQAARAVFVHCVLNDSRWLHADLQRSLWEEVDAPFSVFDGAKLNDAELVNCRLHSAKLGSVDLSRASLEGCSLSSCDFRAARLERTVFRRCKLIRTLWSGLVAPGIELDTCNLKSADLTGSVLTGSSLQGSSLVSAGLADVSWVGCDLRDVDFTHSSFHLGSTRSGLLVGAPPSWGTRTGFYPRDDGLDSSARPEQIRKADLRECDLRGALIEQCDFYLVDLRGAQLSASQIDHLRRCKAILDPEPRVE